jgi:hypothetical protein
MNGQLLGIVLRAVPEVIRMREISGATVRYDHAVFSNQTPDLACGYVTGFLDWIRSGEWIVGMRYTPLGHVEEILRRTALPGYVTVDECGRVLIVLTEAAAQPYRVGHEQEIGWNAIYMGSDGAIMLTVLCEEADSLHPAITVRAV